MLFENPAIYQPENNGWAFENDKYHFKWFEVDQLPSYASDSLKTQSSNVDMNSSKSPVPMLRDRSKSSFSMWNDDISVLHRSSSDDENINENDA
ncbi:hypothetical protein TNIN_169121 [Trichonephila inaurata madagascariensis]|uniref:Uncharacterized protein n=1 Tax=Trichonephila inaurata madagascariensis TaxID=2747483 RepID=A0A8X7CEG3_9ARAC|nr:hypothetical protein TNIN_169121 [Trichonephila inaurata madagascariensis]